MDLQDYVPLKKTINNRKKLIISVIIIIIIILVILIFGIFVSIKNKAKSEFIETSIYYVCADKSKSKKELENMQDGIKEFGGAGKVYQKEDFYYLIINVYFDKESAESVIENNKKVYPNAQILELKTKKVSNKTIRRFKSTDINLRYLKKLNNDLTNIFDLQMKFFSGEITENDLCSKILSCKFDISDFLTEIKAIDGNDYQTLVYNYANLEEMYFATFFNNFFESDKKSSILCEFVVDLSLLKIDFFNNL